jgi:hypothetical protein
MVEVQGFEPRQTESKSVVLPLHNTSKGGTSKETRTPVARMKTVSPNH